MKRAICIAVSVLCGTFGLCDGLASKHSFCTPTSQETSSPLSENGQSRRAFVSSQKVVATALGVLIGGGLLPSAVLSLQGQGHDSDCTSEFFQDRVEVASHCPGCNCLSCKVVKQPFYLHPPAAFAYDREVGADGFRSADTAAMNIQVHRLSH
jgi:hypothetical protein